MRFLRQIPWRAGLFFVGVLLLTACTPTYNEDNIVESIQEQAWQDWGVEVDQVKLEDKHLGVIYQADRLMGEDGKVHPETESEIGNLVRTVERILFSSDLEVDRVSVTAASWDIPYLVGFERDLQTIRKRHLGIVPWQSVKDSTQFQTYPAWHWEPFDTPYGLFSDLSDEALSETLSALVLEKYHLENKVLVNQNALGVVVRQARIWELGELEADAEARLNRALTLATQFALMSGRDFDFAVGILMGGDSDINVHRIGQIATAKQWVMEEITHDDYLAQAEERRTPFWEWHGFGKATLHSEEEFVAQMTAEIQKRLNLRPNFVNDGITQSIQLPVGQSVLEELKNAPPPDNLQRFWPLLERTFLNTHTLGNQLQVAFVTAPDQAICYHRHLQDSLRYYQDELEEAEYAARLERRYDQDCITHQQVEIDAQNP